MPDQLSLDISVRSNPTTHQAVTNPQGYTGLYGFHKYWGKKPHETIAYLIEQLTNPGDTVADPFLGAGTVGRVALLLNRRFLGLDLNPIAIQIAHLLAQPPALKELTSALAQVESLGKARIQSTYTLEVGQTASHFLWENKALKQVWCTQGRKSRLELLPTPHDLALTARYSGYESRYIRTPRFFNNARINANSSMTLHDLFTGRALHNIDILLDVISAQPDDVARILRLCLTAAAGQMSNMVFAITGRGKTRGKTSERIEVGSWVIGYWRPDLHFEVNVWNCFERRSKRLLKALAGGDPLESTSLSASLAAFVDGVGDAALLCTNSKEALSTVPDNSISLVVTDPPHSDRIPYLELSEMWNAIIGARSNFDDEIVVSNARFRGKDTATYNDDMGVVFREIARTLRMDGHLALLFNARRESDWVPIKHLVTKGGTDYGLELRGCFPCNYSTGSVVQDNRVGGLKHDYVLLFGRRGCSLWANKQSHFTTLPGWSAELPVHSGKD